MVTVMSKTIFLDTYSNKSYENGIPSLLLPVHTNFLHFDSQLWWNFIFYYNKSLDPSGYLSFHRIVAHALMLPLLGQLWKQDEPFYLISISIIKYVSYAEPEKMMPLLKVHISCWKLQFRFLIRLYYGFQAIRTFGDFLTDKKASRTDILLAVGNGGVPSKQKKFWHPPRGK